MEIGASFSHTHLEAMGYKPLQSITEFKKLKFKWIRLGCYWNEIEKKKGVFDFSKIDPLVKYCENNNINIALTVGMKAPRYPEYYIPNWLNNEDNLRRFSRISIENKVLLGKTLLFIKKTVKHFSKSSAIKVWQVENEPLDPSGPKWWRIDKTFLQQEIELVKKIDPKRKVAINIWGNELTKRKVYIAAINLADIVAFDIYLRHPAPFLKWFNKYIGPLDPKNKISEVINRIKSNNKEFWLAELQAEPWEPNEIITKKKNPPSFLPKHLNENLEYIKSFNPEVVLLWGFEFWLMRKNLGDKRYWNEAFKVINKFQ